MKSARHYVYRLDHDTGFAPHAVEGLCTSSGCKDNTLEVWSTVGRGSWIIGIGGNNTGKPDKLIYAMEVEERIPRSAFKKKYPAESRYLTQDRAGENVLVSTHFYYFGHKAIDLPEQLEHIIIRTQGCNRVFDWDIESLKTFLSGYRPGVLGMPNNPTKLNTKCGRPEGEELSVPE